ncbi:hypothetical protein EUTSA_v10014846mg [Eutrema salsugineum]|uniref:M-phase phosphoprotein 6 n=1 Tax=Eutrema salsugineum TaxID=72664 RepID=V4N9G1_EUTSA|nr:uncharacterized protein LOC18017112 [Eutrema salsugineum]ESQ42411.1 hypothetical protein EUTSA_v10014846mg [Eutrema salsugineum]
MAKREISSTLRNLKFMQRSASKEEKKKIVEEPNGNFPSLGTVAKKCVVITDWDPQPRPLLGRMSFQSFNPSIEKLHEEAKTDASPTSSSSNGGRMSSSEAKVETTRETNGDLKRKQSDGVSEEKNHPNKSPRNNDKPSPSYKKGFKKPKSKKVDWSVLKPPKPQTKKGLN